MANLTLRLVKESPLTNQEVDNNFTNLNTEKLERNGSIAMTGDLSTTGVKATSTSGLAVKNSGGTSLLLVGSGTTNILTQNNAKIGIGRNPGSAYNLHSDGKIAADVGVYAPIFYDIDNEGFYLNPAATSNLKGLTVTDTITGSVSGSAGSAATLTTARNINGTSFNGSSSITTAKWGTARTINDVSVDGSTDYVIEPYVEDDEDSNSDRFIVFVDNSTAGYKRLNEDSSFKYNPSTNTLTVATLVGNLTGNADTASTWATARTLTLTGDVSGSVSINGSTNVSLSTTVADDSHSHSNYLPLSGGTITGTLTSITSGSTTTSAFYAQTTGGTFAGMYNRYAPYHTYISHTGSSYAPALSMRYLNTGGWAGSYSIGHLSEVEVDAGMFVIHHINDAGGNDLLWSFDGVNGGFNSPGPIYSAGAITTALDLIVGSGQNASNIIMSDADNGSRIIHCNSDRIGFLTQSNVWGSWCDDAGSWYSIGNVVAYFSDERLKTKTGKIENAIDKVKSLEAFYYKANDVAQQYGYNKTEQEIGLSAQQVQAILPEIVEIAPFDRQDVQNDDGTTSVESKSGENYLTLQYERLVPLLVEAIKEQQEQIEELKRIVENK